jgi:glucose-6-phosphate 1-epimerase
MTNDNLSQIYKGKASVSLKNGRGNLPTVFISNKFASSEISLYGAQIQSFKPIGHDEVLWMSEKSMFTEGKPIRGGIPLCFPWFGPNAENNTLPMHGFARLCNWEIEEISDLANESTKLILCLESNEYTRSIWPFEFSAKLIVIVGSELTATLHYSNTSKQEFSCTDALHTYFKVSNIENIVIEGLKDTEYYQGFGMDTYVQKEELLAIKNEENRRYINHTGTCVIIDKGAKRKINVSKTGSKVTVVWNPWDVQGNIPDIQSNGYQTMICVEAVNTYTDVIKLQPGQSFSISTTFGCTSI